jgi:hypothetical protein
VGELYERLLARVTDTPPPRMKVEDAVQAVLEVHKPIAYSGHPEPVCAECEERLNADGPGFWSWPCDTARAIARALDVPIGDQQ